MTDLELRPVDRTELPAFYRTLAEVFGEEPEDADRELLAPIFEPERSLAAFDDGAIVSTAGIYTRDLTVPGGPTPAAGVTFVSVQPTHRRRGLLTAIMRRQLTELHDDQQEPVAVLWASEGGIYRRFGYGVAARQLAWEGTKSRLRLRPEVSTGSGRVVLAAAEQARTHEQAVYEALRPGTAGFLSRPGGWNDRLIADPAHGRNGASARRHALHTEQDGSVSGYATYRIKQDGSSRRNESEVQVQDVFATTPAAYAALWAFLFGIDLVPKLVRGKAPLDDPLPQLVADPRGLEGFLYDSLWVRLADVGRALAARTYTQPVDVVLDVRDEFCPWNARRWRLSGDADGAVCAPTEDAADLTLSAAELGTVYLGGPTLVALRAAGLVTESTPGALVAASRAFAGDRQPWSPEVF
ncbi:MAG TPA: GNAT family N-acetyltransferase [Mycobacteriales bacterium]|nr:GNAT family N-acetyltransferase [Mycobacteriales bacterium]